MISESFPWKMELRRHLLLFNRWSKKYDTQKGGFYLERGVFLSAFILRKLMENRKLTDALRDRSMRCKSFRAFRPLSDRVSRFFGIFDPNKEYDLANPIEVTLSSFDLMSQIMHSYVFIPLIDEETEAWTSFLVNSYRNRDDHLLEVNTDEFERLLSDAIRDDVTEIQVTKHPESGNVIASIRGRPQRGRELSL
jgi:hypothetical protein